MPGTVSRRALFVAVVVSMLGAFVVWYFQPGIEVTVHQELVGPDDRAISLLDKGASLTEIQRAVAESGKHVDQISWLGGSLLYHAVAERRTDVAKWLLAKGASPDGVDHSVLPLGRAIFNEDVGMVRLLVESGADPDIDMTFGLGETPREIAKSIGNAEILSALPSTDRPRTAPATSNAGS